MKTMDQLQEQFAKSLAGMEGALALCKSHVNGYSRKDGTYVKDHDKVANSDWRVGHRVKIHDKGNKLHGEHGHVVGQGDESDMARVKLDSGDHHDVTHSALKPGNGHSWPDVDTGKQTKTKK